VSSRRLFEAIVPQRHFNAVMECNDRFPKTLDPDRESE
jgi:hypothetical protein